MSVGSCMIALAQFGNIFRCLNSLYNSTQLLLSYKTDKDLVGLKKIEQICDNIGREGELICFSKRKQCNVIIRYIAHGQGDLMAKNKNLNPSVSVGANYGGTQGICFVNGVRQGLSWKGDYTTRRLMHYKEPSDLINLPQNWKNQPFWWTLTSPPHGNAMGQQGEDSFDMWMETERQRLGRYPQLTPKQENKKRSSLVQQMFKHGIIRKGHALSWSYLNEIKHIYWRIFINRLCQSITINWVQHSMSFEALDKAISEAFSSKTVQKQNKNYCVDQNSGRLDTKVCSIKLPGPVVDEVVINYPVYSYWMDRAFIDKYGINEQYIDCVWSDRSNIDILPANYVIQVWHNAVDFHLHCLWVEYLGILHIPQFYPKSKYADTIPPLLNKSLQLSIQIYDCLERLQPHGVC